MDAFLNLPDGRRVPARDGLTIGRVAACDVHLDDSKVSRHHARLHVEGSVVEIEDLGSSNGTLLNGKPVTRRMLRDGDEVQIGATRIVFRQGAASAAPAPPRPPALPGAGQGDELFGDDDGPEGDPGPAAPPVAPPPRASVVEFADEVVELHQSPSRAAPRAARPPARPEGGGPVQVQQRLLQFSKTPAGRGVLHDDLAQMSGGARALVYAAVLAAAAGLAWLLIRLVR